MITAKEIEEKTMSASKRAEAKNSIFGFYIGRPISYYLTIPFLYTNISPNVVTAISIIFAILGFAFLSFSVNMSGRLIGLLLIFLWSMGDAIDGNIARYKNLKSENGDLLDTLGGYLAMGFILLGMGCAAYNDMNGLKISSDILPIALGGISAIETLVPRLLMHRKNATKKNANVQKLQDKTTYSISKIIVLNLCDPAGFQEVFMFLAIVFSYLTEFTIIYFIINTIVMVYSIKSLLD